MQSPNTNFHKEEPELLVRSQNVSEDCSNVTEVQEGSLDVAGVAEGTLLLSTENEIGLPVKHYEILQNEKAVAISRDNELVLENGQSQPYIPLNSKDSSACPESSAILTGASVPIELADDKSEGQTDENIKEFQALLLIKNEKQEPVLFTDVGVKIEDKAMLATPLNQIDTYTENDPQKACDSEENVKPDLQMDQRLEDNIGQGHLIGYLDELNAKPTALQNVLQLNTMSDDHMEDQLSL